MDDAYVLIYFTGCMCDIYISVVISSDSDHVLYISVVMSSDAYGRCIVYFSGYK